MTDRTPALDAAVRHARAFLAGLDDRFVGPQAEATALRAALGGPLPEHGEDPVTVIDTLAAGAEPGLVATAGPRHLGFVMGGTLPAALAADWLVSAWDQAPAFHSLSPAGAAIEEITSAWLQQLLGLPPTVSTGFVTGAQGANTVCLAAARHRVLSNAGWDVEGDGLAGAPPVTVIAGEQSHATVFRSLRLLGLGDRHTIRVPADDQGRLDATRLAGIMADGPTIVCAQAGNVATGAFDPFDAIADLCAEHGAWLHVDGAFGLWAAAVPSLSHLTRGLQRAQSWGVDGHKWLNVPYDCAMAFVDDEAAHTAAMSLAGPYLVATPGRRDSANYVPESSRRARAVTVYAALRSLGRAGVVDLIERNCAHARRMAGHLRAIAGVEILNDVVLNQVLARFPGGDDANRAVIAAVQADGTCWVGGTEYGGSHVMRVSFTNWSTTEDDVDRAAAAIRRAAATPTGPVPATAPAAPRA